MPLLDKHGFRATFFVNSGFINHPGHLTWDQLRHMQAKGMEIAGQTIHHTWLTRLSSEMLEHEICDDRGRLLSQGLAADAFAYPFGAFDQRVRRQVVACGYTSARLATGIAGAGKKCVRCPYAETIPPHNRYATRMPPALQRTSKVARITRAVRDAQRTGGGWVQILMHHVCRRCHRYAIAPRALDRLLLWLRKRPGVQVRTVSQLMDIGGPRVRLAPIGGATRSVGNFVTFRVRPASRRGVSRLRFFVDGRLIGVRHIAPYRLRWHTGGLRPGQHTVRVLLEDRRGNAAISPRRMFVKRGPAIARSASG
jgi:peptidoglycan/xylan/chitin deacetylase (PgdA/CDA1 family)